MALTISDHRTANLEDDNRKLKQALQIAAHPQDSYAPDDNEKAYIDSIYKKLNINKEAGKDPVDVFKDGIQGEFDLSKGTSLPEFKPMGRVITGTRDGVLPMKDTKIKQNLQIGPQANMKDSLQRENVGGTLRDMMLPLLIKEYGKDDSGGYKNPSKLLSGMKKLAQGGNPFSTDPLDKQKQIQDYLNNDQKVRDLLIRKKKMKA